MFNLRADLVSAQDLVRFNADYLDTEYKGLEFTATKRFTQKWQMQAGFTIGKNEGGVAGGNDLNDPNNTLFPTGIIGNDSETALRLSGSYELPWADQPGGLADRQQWLPVYDHLQPDARSRGGSRASR